MTRLLAVQSCNTVSKLQTVYLSRCKQNHAQLVRPCLGLLDDPLAPQPCRKGALFSMPSRQPAHIHANQACRIQRNRPPGIRVYLLCHQAEKSRASSYCVGMFAMRSTCQELHAVNTRGPVCCALDLSTAARRQPSADRNHADQSIPHAVRAPTVEGLADSQCSAAQYGTTQPRRNGHMQPSTCSPGRLCKFAQNRAVNALQIRPISTTRDALQELQAAISNGLAAFQSTAGNAAQCSPDRPPGVDPLRLYADGVKFSQNFR